jgi:hypothetical protein
MDRHFHRSEHRQQQVQQNSGARVKAGTLAAQKMHVDAHPSHHRSVRNDFVRHVPRGSSQFMQWCTQVACGDLFCLVHFFSGVSHHQQSLLSDRRQGTTPLRFVQRF